MKKLQIKNWLVKSIGVLLVIILAISCNKDVPAPTPIDACAHCRKFHREDY